VRSSRRRRSVRARLASSLGVAVLLAGTLAVSLPDVRHTSPDTPYKVIVNKSNPVATLTKSELARLFLKKTIVWQGGGEVQPVDLGEDSDARQAFSKQVLGKDISAVKGYWQQLIFTGRGVPPIEKQSEAEVLAFVSANRNAIGYVSAAAALGPDVKVVKITD
jgi:ABC-type phosphate transport system substrate-binding protein